MSDSRNIIDVHVHASPANILKEFSLPDFTEVKRTDNGVKKLGTSASFISPGIFSFMLDKWPAEKYNDFCRKQAAWQATVVASKPATRGSLAPLPLVDIQVALDTFQYLQTLDPKPDGYSITTSTRGKYLGNCHFEPLLDTLNKAKAIVFVHPNETYLPEGIDSDIFPMSTLEYPHETARTLADMLDNSVFIKFPEIRWIFCHNGGTFPFIFQRMVRNHTGANLIGWGGPDNMYSQTNRLAERNGGKTMQQIFSEARVYFDSAQGTPEQHAVLRSLGLTANNFLCGSDAPFANTDNDVAFSLQEMTAAERSGFYSEGEITMIYRGNALELFPRLEKEIRKME